MQLLSIDGRQCADRDLAAAAQASIERPLGIDPCRRARMMQRADALDRGEIARSGLDADGALCGGRQPGRHAQAGPDAGIEAQALQAGHGQDDGVVVAGIELGQTGVDVATQIAHLQIRSSRLDLGMAAQGGGADDGAGRQRVQIGMAVADEGISGVFAFEYRRQFEAGIQLHRHILQRMHRDVGLTAFQRQFQLLQEQTLAADGRQRAIQYLVAARRQRHQFHHQIRVQRAQTRGHMFGLPQGELTLAGGDTQQHARVPAGIRARSREQNGLGGKFGGWNCLVEGLMAGPCSLHGKAGAGAGREGREGRAARTRSLGGCGRCRFEPSNWAGFEHGP